MWRTCPPEPASGRWNGSFNRPDYERYLSLGEALIIGEVVTGIDARTLSRASRLDLLDSALHAPQAGFGDDDFYPVGADTLGDFNLNGMGTDRRFP